MEQLVKQFRDSPSQQNAFSLVKTLNSMNAHNTAMFIGKFLMVLYPDSLNIRFEMGFAAFYSGQYRMSYDLYSKNIENSFLDENDISSLKNNRIFSVTHISNDYINYNKEIVDKIVSRAERPVQLITFTITTCKRFDLFEKTMNSFINCCTDLNRIDQWFCVDDNSSEEDRVKMKEKYPFFTFYFKTYKEKGHPQSMNIIRDHVKTEYIFHMEDDWKFFHPSNYIGKCMDILNFCDNNVGQCLINKNYSETINDIDIAGGLLSKTKNGTRYYMHEYTPDETSAKKFRDKYGIRKNCAYWPHFSFRPSLFKRRVLTIIGPYNEKISHFEMDYSHRYVNNEFKSVFLDGIYCLHTGRLTSQRNNKEIPNAYDLNNESQFSGKEVNEVNDIKEVNEVKKDRFTVNDMEVYVINLKNRPDRLNYFDKVSTINYKIFKAVNGRYLKPNTQLNKIFEGNDFNMRGGLVGVAMSHIKLLIEFLKSDKKIFCIFDDDVTFGPNFKDQLEHTIKNAPPTWDFIYLGHSLYPQFKNDDYNKDFMPTLQKLSVQESLLKSMGGMFAYLITQEGAKKFLDFINITGMTNGIDTMQQKSIDIVETYYCYPHIVFSECALPGSKVDSDIQYNFTSVNMKEYKDNGEYPVRLMKNSEFNIDDSLVFKKINTLEDKFKFFPSIDQIGNDCYRYKESIELCMKRALSDKNCMGFNTLGFFKNKLDKLTQSPYFSQNDGFYVKLTPNITFSIPKTSTF